MLSKSGTCFDRTYEELKLVQIHIFGSTRNIRFDRTYEELKLREVAEGCEEGQRFDRTYEELKLAKQFADAVGHNPF